MHQETSKAAVAAQSAAAGAEVDDVTLNRMAMDACRARAQAAEVETRANELLSQLPDDDIPREIAEARNHAAIITGVAETIERELRGARTEREQGRRGMTHGRAQTLCQQVGHLLQVAEAECQTLAHVKEEAVSHKAVESARAESGAPKTPTVVQAAKPVQATTPVRKKAAPVAAAALAGVPAPHLARAAPEPAPAPAPGRLGRVVQQAQEVAEDLFEAASNSAGNVADTVREAGSRALVHTQAVLANPWQSAKDAAKAVLPAPVIGVARTVRNRVKRAAAQLYDSAVEAKDTALGWMPWREAPHALAAAPSGPTPVPKPEGLLSRAMRQAASIGLPASLSGMAGAWSDSSLPSLPNIKALAGQWPGLY